MGTADGTREGATVGMRVGRADGFVVGFPVTRVGAGVVVALWFGREKQSGERKKQAIDTVSRYKRNVKMTT